MGKGRIITAHGEGRYTLEILEDRDRIEAAKATAQQRVATINQRVTELDNDIADAQDAVNRAAAEQDTAIAQYQAEMQAGGESTINLTEYAVAVQEAASKRDTLKGHRRAMEVERRSLQSRIDLINALPPLRQTEAWCADYTEDLFGEVATAEVPGEVGQVIIKPGFDGANQWLPGVDGAIQPALSGTPASVFYNLAMLPGWQKWRPTFRIATVSNIDNDLCDITLDAATSSQQGLNVNAQDSYSGVPIMYMDCNGAAFEEGDRALVAFSGNTDRPMVVGFEQEPKECRIPGILVLWLQLSSDEISVVSSAVNAWWTENLSKIRYNLSVRVIAANTSRFGLATGYYYRDMSIGEIFDIYHPFQYISSNILECPNYNWANVTSAPSDIISQFVESKAGNVGGDDYIGLGDRTIISVVANPTLNTYSDSEEYLSERGVYTLFEEHDAIIFTPTLVQDKVGDAGWPDHNWGPLTNVHDVGENNNFDGVDYGNSGEWRDTWRYTIDRAALGRIADKIISILERRGYRKDVP